MLTIGRRLGERIILIIIPILLIALNLEVQLSHADNADVLPKGIFRIGLNSKFYLTVDEQFDENGDKQDIGEDFETSLDSTVFPELQLIEQGFGMPPGSATLGDTEVDIEYDFYIFELTPVYGLTNRLSIGAKIPYWVVEADVKDANVDTSNATVGVNPFFGTPGDPFGVPIIPIAVGGVADDDLATEIVQSELENRGFDRLEDWDNNGIGDIEAGCKYQYLRTEDLRLAFLGGFRAPTGETDDPDNLIDYPLGSGAWWLLFYLNNTYTGTENLILDFTIKYELSLPDKERVRVPESRDQPLTGEKEKVDRNLGDLIELEVEALYQFREMFNIGAIYNYAHKFSDSVSGDKDLNYESLEDDSHVKSHIVKVNLGFSTIPLFRDKKFPIPMTVTLTYRDRFAGQNKLNSQYIGLNIVAFF
jgi:hypothetical protein